MIPFPRRLAAFNVLLWVLFAVAASGINSDSLWYDEFLSLQYAGWPSEQVDLVSIVERIVSSTEHRVITYDIMLAVWLKFAGWSVFSARLLSLFFGLLAIVWVYRLGCELNSSTAGVCAAVLMGGSAMLSVYMHEIRTYSLLALSTVVLIWLYWRMLQRQSNWKLQAAFLLTATATLYTHPLAFAQILSLGVYHVLLAPRGQAWRRLLLLFVLTGILYAPWALASFNTVSSFLGTDLRALTFRTNLDLVRGLARGLSNGIWPFLLLPLFALRRLRRDRGLQLVWTFGLAFLAAMLVTNYMTGVIYHLRYLLPIFPVVALLGGIGCASLLAYRKAVALILAAWCLAGIYSVSTFGSEFYFRQEHDIFHYTFPFRELVEDLRASAGEGDVIAFEFPYHSWALHGVIDFYMHGADTHYVLTDSYRFGADWRARLKNFEQLLDEAERLFFVVDRTIDASGSVAEYERILERQHQLCERLWDSETVRVDIYARADASCESR